MKLFPFIFACIVNMLFSSSAYASPAAELHIKGNHFVNAVGQTVQLRGATLSLLEYSCSPRNRYVREDYEAMKKWNMNAVKIPVNPNYWMGNECDQKYHDAVYTAVKNAEDAGFYVILSMLAFEKSGSGDKMPMQTSVDTWKEIAQHYAKDGMVLFETFSEPHDITWKVWRDGDSKVGYIGIQALVNTINNAAPERIVLANGLPWGGTLLGLMPGYDSLPHGYILTGRNLGYTVHFYPGPDTENPEKWYSAFGDIAAQTPVVVSEFGDTHHCDNSWLKDAMPYIAAHSAGFFAWAWDNDKNYCHRPSLIKDWQGTPTPYGQPIYEFYLKQ